MVSVSLAIKQELMRWVRQEQQDNVASLPSDLQKVIKAQRKVGWRAFLDGLFVLGWEEYQGHYFENIGSKKSASLWVTKAIRACWDYNMFIWTARNEQLHKTERILEFEGKKEVIEAIKKEYKIGLGRLPAYGFSEMFRHKEEEIIKESLDTMRNWLGIIKQGRIVFQDPNRVEDEFYVEGALKKSLELVELTEDEIDGEMI